MRQWEINNKLLNISNSETLASIYEKEANVGKDYFIKRIKVTVNICDDYFKNVFSFLNIKNVLIWMNLYSKYNINIKLN